MNFKLLCILICLLKLTEMKRNKLRNLDDVELLIDAAGYKSEVHLVETQDGYILKMHRILRKTPSNEPKRGPVLFMHGMFATAADYIVRASEDALPYMLSSNGYDVWLGNARGNDHSRKHKTLSSETFEFWNFSWHEIGFYDLPAMIDYMLNYTNAEKAFYVGHSQGGTSLLVFLSTRPEYNQKIIQAHLFAPAAVFKDFPNPILKVVTTLGIKGLGNLPGAFDLSHPILKDGAHNTFNFLCQESSPSRAICEALVFLICGFNKGEIESDPKILPNLLTHLAHAVSLKQPEHYYQIISSERFRHYDYFNDNMKIYNSSSPPDYNLKNIVTKIYLYTAMCDALVNLQGVMKLEKALPNVRKHKKLENYNHCDFSYSVNSRKLLFEEMIVDFNSENTTVK